MDADGMRIDALEAALDRLAEEGRTPKFIYTVPSFQNPAGVTMALDRRRRLVRIAAERELLVLEDNPYGLLRYEGEAQPTLYAHGRGRVRHLPRDVLEDPLARPAPRLGGRARRPCCRSSTSASRPPTCAPPRSRSTSWPPSSPTATGAATSPASARSTTAAATSCSRRWREHFPAEATWTRPEGGLFLWATLPAYIDTTDLLARALREHVAFVPGRAAYLDGRGGTEMRLNFSGVGEADIREGVRRIGKVVREQVGLYSTLTGAEPARRRARSRRPGRATPRRARASSRCAAAARGPPASGEPRRRPEGRAVAGARGLAALGGARGARARAAGPRGDRHRRRARPRRAPHRRAAGGRRRRHARPRRRGRDRAGAAGARRACPTRPPGRRPASAASTRCWPSTTCATPASRRPTSTPSTRPPSRRWAPPTRSRRSRSASPSPWW